MSTGRLRQFASTLLADCHSNRFFESLNTLPPVRKISKDKKNAETNENIIVDEHPLVLIESQVTLFKIKNTLEILAETESILSPTTIEPLQEILYRRFLYRLAPTNSTA